MYVLGTLHKSLRLSGGRSALFSYLNKEQIQKLLKVTLYNILHTIASNTTHSAPLQLVVIFAVVSKIMDLDENLTH